MGAKSFRVSPCSHWKASKAGSPPEAEKAGPKRCRGRSSSLQTACGRFGGRVERPAFGGQGGEVEAGVPPARHPGQLLDRR